MTIYGKTFYNCILLLFIVNEAGSIPIDNGVIGDPNIECGAESIGITFETQKEFEGNVYVKGLFDNNNCKVVGDNSKSPQITLPFDSCNTKRTRSINPRGIFVSAVVVISFHPLFVTKVDRAYRLQCFYMEADKTVSTEIEVSELTTVIQTNNVPMPTCKYEILSNGPSGEPISFATIGTQVYHKWTCDTDAVDTFCMTVYSCFVESATGEKVEIINAEGCALDKYILNNLEYPSDLMAGQEAHIYKFADKSQLFYQCQIAISIKEPNGECPRPNCDEPVGFGAVESKTDSKDSGVSGHSATLPIEPQRQPPAKPANRPNQPAARPAQQPNSGDLSSEPSPPNNAYYLRRARLLRKRHAVDGGIVDVTTELEAIDITSSDNTFNDFSSRNILPNKIDERICFSAFTTYLFLTTILFTAGVLGSILHLCRKSNK